MEELSRDDVNLKALPKLLKAYTSSFIEWVLADLTCEYGTSWFNPILIWVFTVLGLFPLLYWLTKSIPSASDPLDYMFYSIFIAPLLMLGEDLPVRAGRDNSPKPGVRESSSRSWRETS